MSMMIYVHTVCKVHKQHLIRFTIECFARRTVRVGTPFTIHSLHMIYTGVYKARSLNIQIHSLYKKQRSKEAATVSPGVRAL